MQRLTNSMVAMVRTKMLTEQKGKCALCNTEIAKLPRTASGKVQSPVLDHDHTTGVCRAVLCNNCNGLEGKVINLATRAKRERTPLEWLKQLVEYLTHHQVNRTALLHPTHKSAEEKRILTNKKARLKRQAVAKEKAKAKGAT